MKYKIHKGGYYENVAGESRSPEFHNSPGFHISICSVTYCAGLFVGPFLGGLQISPVMPTYAGADIVFERGE